MKLPILFPSEAAQLRQQLQVLAGATPEERLRAVADTLAAAEALSSAGGRRQQQLRYEDSIEQQWRDRMREFIAQHVPARTPAAE